MIEDVDKCRTINDAGDKRVEVSREAADGVSLAPP
jgi:hypothetical protein